MSTGKLPKRHLRDDEVMSEGLEIQGAGLSASRHLTSSPNRDRCGVAKVSNYLTSDVLPLPLATVLRQPRCLGNLKFSYFNDSSATTP